MSEQHACPACHATLVSEPDGASLHCPACRWHLITLKEWRELPPLQQGYALYMQSSWPTSELAKVENPYAANTPAWRAFRDGERRATLSAQDGEE